MGSVLLRVEAKAKVIVDPKMKMKQMTQWTVQENTRMPVESMKPKAMNDLGDGTAPNSPEKNLIFEVKFQITEGIWECFCETLGGQYSLDLFASNFGRKRRFQVNEQVWNQKQA